jgi:hypothetical protein
VLALALAELLIDHVRAHLTLLSDNHRCALSLHDTKPNRWDDLSDARTVCSGFAATKISQTVTNTFLLRAWLIECVVPVLHSQKHSRYSLVPLIPCAESAPGTYSSGTPATWNERREQPCNLLRTPAIAARSSVSTVQTHILCTLIGVCLKRHRQTAQSKPICGLHVSKRIAA